VKESVRYLPPLHDSQHEVFCDPARFKVCFCGRRWGKTELGVDEIIRGATTQPGLYWWVGLTWQSASMKRAWRLLKQRFRGVAEIKESTHEIILGNGSEIWMRTAEREDSLDGEALRGVVLDEFTLMGSRVWAEHIRASLSDFRGWALFIGVPKGRNWAYALWTRCQNESLGEWKGWQRPTKDNPFIPADEIESARNDMAELLYAQEYEAEIIDDNGSVFRRILEAATVVQVDGPVADHSYVVGVDWGKTNDFTVVTVIDETTREIVKLDRFNQIDYTIQKSRLVALVDRFRPVMVIAEVNSMGAPLIDDLKKSIPIRPFTTTNASKTQAIEALALAFERGEIKIPERGPHAATLIAELQAYTQERMASGLMRFGAPEGGHDDMVMSAAFAWHGASGGGMSNPGWVRIFRQHAEQKRKEAVA
jgi:phage terminase large subunit-like protein